MDFNKLMLQYNSSLAQLGAYSSILRRIIGILKLGFFFLHKDYNEKRFCICSAKPFIY
jgi:hypothetical protein